MENVHSIDVEDDQFACKGICAALYPKYTGTGSKFWKRYCMAIDHSGTDL